MRDEILQAEIDLLLADDSLSRSDRSVWISALENSPPAIRLLLVLTLKSEPSLLAFATYDLKQKLAVMRGEGTVANVLADEESFVNKILISEEAVENK
jgi:hypothetical protein